MVQGALPPLLQQEVLLREGDTPDPGRRGLPRKGMNGAAPTLTCTTAVTALVTTVFVDASVPFIPYKLRWRSELSCPLSTWSFCGMETPCFRIGVTW